MKKITEYVVGFLFYEGSVLLILKNRPQWQFGRLNGVGGHVKRGEKPATAMAREFSEEAGWNTLPEHWKNFGVVTYPKARVHLFCYLNPPNPFGVVRTMTDEEVGWYPINVLHKLPVIENLNWMIPMALRDEEWFYEVKGKGHGPNC